MNSRTIATLIASFFVLLIATFFACMGGLVAALGVALVLPFIYLGMERFFEIELPQPWIALLPVTLASALGVGLWTLPRENSEPFYWAVPVVATLLLGGVLWWRSRGTQRCGLCNTRLDGKVAFGCPRCGMQVCEDNCWQFEKLRCRLCVQNQVPLFPSSKQWWDKNVGLATKFGRCQHCQAPPEEAELRSCPKCGRPQCLECWDDGNGLCTRCGWRVNELPEALKAFLP